MSALAEYDTTLIWQHRNPGAVEQCRSTLVARIVGASIIFVCKACGHQAGRGLRTKEQPAERKDAVPMPELQQTVIEVAEQFHKLALSGNLAALACVAETPRGEMMHSFSECENRFTLGAFMIATGLKRMGVTMPATTES